MKIALAQINPTVGDLDGNLNKITKHYEEACHNNSDLVVFPELCVTGYPAEDLILRKAFLKDTAATISKLEKITKDKDCGLLISAPTTEDETVYNSALLIADGRTIVTCHKHCLPNYGVFDEKRIFKSGPTPQPVEFKGKKLGILVCEDIWYEDIPHNLAKAGAEILLTLNASPYDVEKAVIRSNIATTIVKQTKTPVVYVNQLGGQDDLVFDGGSFAVSSDGSYGLKPSFWKEELRYITWEDSIITSKDNEIENFDENAHIYQALMLGLKDYVNKNGFEKVLLGISGGIDSALVATIATDALGEDKVWGIRLPSQHSSYHSLDDAEELANNLGCNQGTIPIEDIYATVDNSLSDIFSGKKADLTEENMQARIRGLTLMAISNKHGELLLTTGNKSEYAVGYATLYGDMCGALAIIKDVYKTKVYELSKWRNENIPYDSKLKKTKVIPNNSIVKPPSAELRPDQTDQDSLPEYDVLDAILYELIEKDKSISEISKKFDKNLVTKVNRLLNLAEYKRRQSAPGIKVSTRDLARDRRYPIINRYTEI